MVGEGDGSREALLLRCQSSMGEILALDHYCPLGGKTKGTRSTP